jgi:hypothetical protein
METGQAAMQHGTTSDSGKQLIDKEVQAPC